MSLALTTTRQRKAAALLRKIADSQCEALHFAQRARDAKSADAAAHFDQTSFTHEQASIDALHSLASLLNVDIETRTERPC